MSGKLEQIQGIRALAILGIFIAHTSLWISDDLGWFKPIPELLGGSGVVTFFMISGFLLSYKNKLVPNLRMRDLIGAAWSKVGKMYGLYFITVLVILVFHIPSTIKGWMQLLICLPLHLTLTQDFVPVDWLTQAFNGPAWFLSALFGIWILVFLCHESMNRLNTLSAKKSVIAIIVILVMQMLWLLLVNDAILPMLKKNHFLIWGYKWLRYSNPLLCFSEFCVGILLGRICLIKSFSVTVQNICALLAVGLLMVFRGMTSMHMPPFRNSWIVIVECIVLVGVVAVMSHDAIGYKILSFRPFVWLGNLSGYVFLLHHPTNICVHATIGEYIPKPWLFFASLSLCIAFSACADFYYKWRISKVSINK